METPSATLRADASTQTEPEGSAAEATAIRKGSVIGRYVVLREVGRGGMGAVYAAYDPRLDRRVALKLLLDRGRGAEAIARLLREAQALARLNHPNVVTVHDVGEVEDRVFVAMEFVEGRTLRQWQRDGDHPWREVLALYRQAAQGLAAAHAAGVVHRDFKPENAMLSDDGRVKVMDFGLARSGPASAEASPDADHDVSTLTREGMLVGTPAYMSPEQFKQRPVGPASDQFSFCVALHEALVGQRPFKGNSVHELAVAVAAGRIRDTPRGTAAPRWLLQVVRTGLAPRAEDRHPSMAALLAAIERGLGRRRRVLLASGGVGLLAVFIGGTLRPDQDAPCRRAAEEIRAVWTPERDGEIEAALVATGHASARDSWQRARVHVDAFVSAWIEQYDHLCGAWRGALSDELLELRRQCLVVQRSHLEGLLDAFTNTTVETIGFAVAATAGLPGAEECAQIDALDGAPPVEWAEEVTRAQRLAAHAAARRRLGDAPGALAAYDEALAVLEDVPAPRAHARILAGRANLRAFEGDIVQGERDRALAQRLAAHSGDTELSSQLWLDRLTHLNIEHPEELDRQEHLLEAVELAVLQADNPPAHVAKLSIARGIVAMDRGHFERAREHLEAGVALAEAADATPSARASYHDLVGHVLIQLGDYDGAQVQMKRAVEIGVDAYGPAYPSLRTFHGNLGGACLYDGDLACAREHFEAVQASLDAAGDHASPARAHSLANLAELEDNAGHPALVRRHAEAAIDVWRRLGAEDSLDAAAPLRILGEEAREAGQLDEALELAQRVDRIYARHRGPDHPGSVEGLSGVADVLVLLGRHDEALAAFDRVLAVRQAALGPTHESVAIALGNKAGLLETMGQIAAALDAARRADEIVTELNTRPRLRGDTAFLHARLLWASGRDNAGALDLARRALRHYDGSPGAVTDARSEVAAWLAAREPPD